MTAQPVIVIDEAIYPRASIDAETVARYAAMLEAGSPAPPVIVEQGTGRLLDGRHRYEAHHRLGRLDELQVEERPIPDGWTPILLAASLAARNGLPLTASDAQSVARHMYATGGDMSVTEVAKALLVPRKTVEGWLSAQIEERREVEARERRVRRLLAVMLRRAGWTQQKIADHLGIAKQTVSQSMAESPLTDIAEPEVWSAVHAGPDGVDLYPIARDLLDEAIFSTWTQPERDLLARHRDGETVVVNMRADAHARLWEWALSVGAGERIDRKSIWGNPFLLDADGTRDQVCDHFVTYYALKPSLHQRIEGLRGKVLGCWCAPARCHGDHLADEAESVALDGAA